MRFPPSSDYGATSPANFACFVCFAVRIPVLSLRFRHLSPALSPIETERENYRQSVGVFMAIRGIRVNDFAPFVPFCGRIEFRVVRVFRGWHPCLVFAVSTPHLRLRPATARQTGPRTE